MDANKEPKPLEGHAERQLDAVDAAVFSGDPYAPWNKPGQRRFRWYLGRWTRETYGADVPMLAKALRDTLDTFRESMSADAWKEWTGESVHGPLVRNSKIVAALALVKTIEDSQS